MTPTRLKSKEIPCVNAPGSASKLTAWRLCTTRRPPCTIYAESMHYCQRSACTFSAAYSIYAHYRERIDDMHKDVYLDGVNWPYSNHRLNQDYTYQLYSRTHPYTLNFCLMQMDRQLRQHKDMLRGHKQL
jgi:hypothetical protein